jgi:hypothetical protein
VGERRQRLCDPVYATLLVIGLIGRYGDVERVPDVLERTDVLLLTACSSRQC